MTHMYTRSIFLFLFTALCATASIAQPCAATVVSTQPGSRCGAGPVLLSGHASAGATMAWFDASSGGSAIGYGDTFLTPALSADRTFYAAATTGSTVHAGAPNPTVGTNWGSTNLNSYQIFSVTRALTLQSVTVYPVDSGSITVGLQTSTGTTLQQATFSIALPGGTGYSYVPLGGGSNTTIGNGVVLPVNFNIPVGSGYRLVQLDNDSRVVRNTAGVPTSYYNTNVNGLTITGNWIGSSGSSLSYWYNFYDWVVATGDSTQCQSARQAVLATVHPLPTVSAGADQYICSGTPLTLGSGTADTYLWSTGATTATISVTTAGTYSVRGTITATGCYVSDTVHISSIAAPTVGSISATFNSPEYTLVAIGAQSATGYMWDFGDGTTSTDQQPLHTYGAPGNYVVRLCVTNQCYTSCTGLTPSANTQYVQGTLVVSIAGIDETAAAIGLRVYPQPVQDILHVQVSDEVRIQSLTVYSLLGARLLRSESYTQAATVSVAALPDGIYLLDIMTDHGRSVQRFSISHP